MNAKEYLDNKDKNLNDGRVRLSRPQIIALIEEYHQLKSEEEAEKRHKKALSYYDKETYMNGKSITAVVNALRIASGNKKE